MINTIKQTLKRIPFLSDIARRLYLKIKTPINSTTYWIEKISNKSDFNVVQIGSNDGKTGDPIFGLIKKNKRWKVLFVEPVPYLFERLKNNYKDEPRFRFENVAINDGSKQIFYWVNKAANKNFPDLPEWYDQLGSFNKNHILKHLNGKLEDYITESEIQGISLGDLFKKYNIDDFDFLHIDTEGYDWKILSQLDLNKYSPLLILFEHTHLLDSERELSIKFLNEHYFIFVFGGDFLCLRRGNNILSKKDLDLIKNVSIQQ